VGLELSFIFMMHVFEDKLENTACDKHLFTGRAVQILDEQGHTQRAIASITSDGECSNQLCGQNIYKNVRN
jgi:hypothetical protein